MTAIELQSVINQVTSWKQTLHCSAAYTHTHTHTRTRWRIRKQGSGLSSTLNSWMTWPKEGHCHLLSAYFLQGPTWDLELITCIVKEGVPSSCDILWSFPPKLHVFYIHSCPKTVEMVLNNNIRNLN